MRARRTSAAARKAFVIASDSPVARSIDQETTPATPPVATSPDTQRRSDPFRGGVAPPVLSDPSRLCATSCCPSERAAPRRRRRGTDERDLVAFWYACVNSPRDAAGRGLGMRPGTHRSAEIDGEDEQAPDPRTSRVMLGIAWRRSVVRVVGSARRARARSGGARSAHRGRRRPAPGG